jgi:hypothetical protein
MSGNELLNKTLLQVGSIGLGSTVIETTHTYLQITLQITGLITFFIYLVINWDQFEERGSKHYTRLFKRKR